ncbi:MAG: PHP domain-containing protein [Saprospiraceae bacterium]|nr:PHP domain-containing protein [Saprospiraceae bacterium]
MLNNLTLLMMSFGMLVLGSLYDDPLVLTGNMHHLRIEGEREWNEFSELPESADLELTFESRQNSIEWSLRLRQYDVKQRWAVSVNGQELGHLQVDENDMVVYFPVPAGALLGGSNVLHIHQLEHSAMIPDDILVGEIFLAQKSVREDLSEGEVEIEVLDEDLQHFIPSRVTILNENGALQTTAAVSNDHLAVRPGTLFTSTGKLRFAVPAGNYTLYAGRGFEYSLDSKEISVSRGNKEVHHMQIRREVPTAGYVSSDTHIHSRTHSGHGDATVEERMITLAAEGVELPIATDHNKHIDYRAIAKKMKVLDYFTPVIGNEVTTNKGHFNVFPVAEQARIPDYQLGDWQSILADIYRTPNVTVAILNHPRDKHSGITPFGPDLFNPSVGENVRGWAMNFNAVEVLNSGATQSDVLQLFHDWMALLNRGYQITPIGSSDSHDVARHFVGQGRTYIRCDDRDPANIDVSTATRNLLQGQVMVSYGLLAEMTIAGKYRSGDLVRMPQESIDVSVRILGPHWTSASTLQLYANGQLVRTLDVEQDSEQGFPVGVKWAGSLQLPRSRHDIHLVAIALGPGIDGAYWKTAKPYQSKSSEWHPKVVGCSGAIWIDVDGDGRRTSAYDYAKDIFIKSKGDLSNLIELLEDYDESVVAQTAHLWQKSGTALWGLKLDELLSSAAESTRKGFRMYQKSLNIN